MKTAGFSPIASYTSSSVVGTSSRTKPAQVSSIRFGHTQGTFTDEYVTPITDPVKAVFKRAIQAMRETKLGSAIWEASMHLMLAGTLSTFSVIVHPLIPFAVGFGISSCYKLYKGWKNPLPVKDWKDPEIVSRDEKPTVA